MQQAKGKGYFTGFFFRTPGDDAYFAADETPGERVIGFSSCEFEDGKFRIFDRRLKYISVHNPDTKITSHCRWKSHLYAHECAAFDNVHDAILALHEKQRACERLYRPITDDNGGNQYTDLIMPEITGMTVYNKVFNEAFDFVFQRGLQETVPVRQNAPLKFKKTRAP